MPDLFKVIHPNLSNNQIFNVKFDDQKVCDLFDLKIKKTNPIDNGNGDGVYSIHYKEKLIYIGRHNTSKNVVERWEKHIKTLTGRFLPINFLGADKDPNNNNIVKKFYSYNKKKLSFNELINHFNKNFIQKKNNIISHPDQFNEIRDIIQKHIKKKRDELNLRYKIFDKNFQEFFSKIDAFSNKIIIQTLTGEGSVTSPNRFNFAIKNREELITKNKNNIFDDFTFFFYKHLGKNITNQKGIVEFQNKFEKPLIKYFSPEANNDSDKGSKIINGSYVEILNYLNKI